MPEQVRLLTILIIDDDRDYCTILNTFLESEGFEISLTHSAAQAIEAMQDLPPDLVLLDIALPDGNGIPLCSYLRTIADMPIILISGIATEIKDIIIGLEAGADDYLSKPLDLPLLKARIDTVLRRSLPPQTSNEFLYHDGYLSVHVSSQQVFIQGKATRLSYTGFRLLHLLVSNANQVISISEIIEELWQSDDYSHYAQYVHIYVGRVRRVIEPHPSDPRYIINEHGMGYMFFPYE